MKTVTVYTDGACSGNPGPGGWGAILQYGPHTKELSCGERNTTNNRMELTGVIRALQTLKEPCIVELYSDSKYVIDALAKGWAKGWRARGWIKSDKKPALNPDLWEPLLAPPETGRHVPRRWLLLPALSLAVAFGLSVAAGWWTAAAAVVTAALVWTAAACASRAVSGTARSGLRRFIPIRRVFRYY